MSDRMQLVVATPCFGGKVSSISDVGEVASHLSLAPVAAADAA